MTGYPTKRERGALDSGYNDYEIYGRQPYHGEFYKVTPRKEIPNLYVLTETRTPDREGERINGITYFNVSELIFVESSDIFIQAIYRCEYKDHNCVMQLTPINGNEMPRTYWFYKIRGHVGWEFAVSGEIAELCKYAGIPAGIDLFDVVFGLSRAAYREQKGLGRAPRFRTGRW